MSARQKNSPPANVAVYLNTHSDARPAHKHAGFGAEASLSKWWLDMTGMGNVEYDHVAAGMLDAAAWEGFLDLNGVLFCAP